MFSFLYNMSAAACGCILGTIGWVFGMVIYGNDNGTTNPIFWAVVVAWPFYVGILAASIYWAVMRCVEASAANDDEANSRFLFRPERLDFDVVEVNKEDV